MGWGERAAGIAARLQRAHRSPAASDWGEHALEGWRARRSRSSTVAPQERVRTLGLAAWQTHHSTGDPIPEVFDPDRIDARFVVAMSMARNDIESRFATVSPPPPTIAPISRIAFGS